MKAHTVLAAVTVVITSFASAHAAPRATAHAVPQAPAQTAPQTAAGPASQEHRTMPRPTNLQVLPKDIPTEDLIKLMRGYSAELGVHCTFCHAVNEQTHRPDFASDAKPEKAIARTMIVMTQEINSKYLSQVHVADTPPEMKVVTCGTCHRGMSMPAPFVPAPEGK